MVDFRGGLPWVVCHGEITSVGFHGLNSKSGIPRPPPTPLKPKRGHLLADTLVRSALMLGRGPHERQAGDVVKSGVCCTVVYHLDAILVHFKKKTVAVAPNTVGSL